MQNRRVVPLFVAVLVALSAGGAGVFAIAAPAEAAGIIPPNDPSANVPFQVEPNCSVDCTATLLEDTNYARSLEGVGPMNLPSNFASLTPAEQELAIVNQERVGRGLAPEYGLSSFMDGISQTGATEDSDPPLGPSGSFFAENGNFFEESGTSFDVPLLANYYWMYVDGPGGINFDCPSAGAPGCWGHRNNILNSDCSSTGTTCVMGAAVATGSGVTTMAEALGVYFGPGNPPAADMDYLASSSGGSNAPTVSSFSPTSGPSTGGTSVTINGTNLTGASAVHFGSALGTGLSVLSASQVRVSAPAGSGAVSVSVTTPGGTASAPGTFSYIVATPAPTVSSFSPTSGPSTGGTSVTINGTNLTGASAVHFGSALGTGLSVLSASQVRVSAPAGSGAVSVSVTTPGGTASAPGTFSYIVATPAPTVSSFSPTSGPSTGGTSVTINGTNLTGASAVHFGSALGTGLSVLSASQVRVSAPAGSGAVSVSVTTPGGTASAPGTFSYIMSGGGGGGVPVVTSISPTSGPAGTVVTITGSGFTSSSAVEFGSSSAASTTFISATELRAVVPNMASVYGTRVNVYVVNANGTSAISRAGVFTYLGSGGLFG